MSDSPLLKGVKILDMSRVLALPFATMILSDLGAEVLKIERPDGGDETRGWGPPYFGSESAYYLCVNRNKKSVTVDIRTEKGQEIIRSLAKESDVFVENFRPGVLKKYGLDYNSIREINPSIIYCSLSGFGQDNPNSHLPGYDFIIQGLSGFMSITGEPDGEPMKVGVAIMDVIAGLYATIAIIASLYRRMRDGEGEYIDVALFDAAISALVNVASNYLVSGVLPKRYGNAHPNIVPYQTFRAKDTYFNVAVGNDEQWKRLVRIIGEKELEDERFSTNDGRVRHRKELIELLSRFFIKKTADEWIALLQDASIPVGKINTLEDVFNSSQVRYREMLKVVRHPHGDLKLVASPLKFQNHSVVEPKAPPLLGEHTEEILNRLDLKGV